MPIYRWRDKQSVIARLIDEKDIHGFLKQDVILNPGEAAMIIARGKIEDVITQTELKDFGGGFSNWIKRLADMESDKQLLFLVTTPVLLELPITATTKDYQTMNGTVRIRVQLSTVNAPKIVNLMEGYKVLTNSGLEKRIQAELVAMVFSNVVAKYTVEEFHGNIEIQREMEISAIVELRKTLGLWGLELLKMFTVWQEGAFDELMKYKAELELHDSEENAYHKSLLRVIQREHEYNLKIQEYKWDLLLGEIKGEERVKTEQFLLELERGQAKFDEELRREYERLELAKEELKAELASDRKEMDMALDSFERVQSAKRERMKLEQRAQAKEVSKPSGSVVFEEVVPEPTPEAVPMEPEEAAPPRMPEDELKEPSEEAEEAEHEPESGGESVSMKYNCDIKYPTKVIKEKTFEVNHIIYPGEKKEYSKSELKKQKLERTALEFPEPEPEIVIEVLEDDSTHKWYRARNTRQTIKLSSERETIANFMFSPETVWKDGLEEKISFGYIYKDKKIAEVAIKIQVFESQIQLLKTLKITSASVEELQKIVAGVTSIALILSQFIHF